MSPDGNKVYLDRPILTVSKLDLEKTREGLYAPDNVKINLSKALNKVVVDRVNRQSHMERVQRPVQIGKCLQRRQDLLVKYDGPKYSNLRNV